MRPEKSFWYDRTQDADQPDPEFEALLDYLKQNRGCDFTGYKRPSLMRRFNHRMHNLRIETYQNYLQYLQRHSEEPLALTHVVLINFTGFFRDSDAWNYLATEVIPQIVASQQPGEPIRVWSAGCASGQEIYSLLILLAEALGIASCMERVQCYATDADEQALEQAQEGEYSALEIIDIPPDLLEKYFELNNKGYVFHSELRRLISFEQHNLLKDPSLTNIDLLLCRNVLMYFVPEAQESILARFYSALKNTGFLFLGQAETLFKFKQRQIFMPVNLKQRIYTKWLESPLDNHLLIVPTPRKPQAVGGSLPPDYFWEKVFEQSSLAHLVLDANGCLLHANAQARTLFGLTRDDRNRPFQELEPAKLISLDLLTKALHLHQGFTALKDVEWTTEKGTQHFDIDISLMLTPENHLLGTALTFIESDGRKLLTKELESTRSELASISQTLQQTKSELRRVYRKLASTQQELEFLTEDMGVNQQEM